MKPIIFHIFILIFSITLYRQWEINGVAFCDTVGKKNVAVNGILSDGTGRFSPENRQEKPVNSTGFSFTFMITTQEPRNQKISSFHRSCSGTHKVL